MKVSSFFKRAAIVLLLPVFCFAKSNAEELIFSDSAQISLLTCSPGKIAYEKFGHTAIRVWDQSMGIDVVFNYGLFSFYTNNFYYKFVKGETDYMLGATTTDAFLPEYAHRNSSVTEQVLNLTAKEKENLLQALILNYQPQNRVYRYNFVYDNCSTRPRDLIMNSVDGVVIFPKTNSVDKTFREYIETYVGWNTWLMFGIDIVFGSVSDVYVNKMTTMFLPEILMDEFKDAIVVLPNDSAHYLVKDENILVHQNGKKVSKVEGNLSPLLRPIGISTLFLLLGILITYWDLKRKRRNKIFNFILLLVSGLTGLIAFYLAFFSLHPMVQSNYNLLWLNPLNIVAAFIIWYRPWYRVLFYYFIIYILMLLGALAVFALNVQSVNVAFIPLIVLLIVRSMHWLINRRNSQFKIKIKNLLKKRSAPKFH